jgi:hypothetical protein
MMAAVEDQERMEMTERDRKRSMLLQDIELSLAESPELDLLVNDYDPLTGDGMQEIARFVTGYVANRLEAGGM